MNPVAESGGAYHLFFLFFHFFSFSSKRHARSHPYRGGGFYEKYITDLTITFVESHYPVKLIKHLKNVRGYTVAKSSAGIYTVSGDILPIQIIDSRKLSAEDNLWLKNLSNSLDRLDIELISAKIAQKGKAVKIKAYMYAIGYANIKKIMEKKMKRKPQPDYDQLLLELFIQLLEVTDTTEIWEEKILKKRRKEIEKIVADQEAEIADQKAEIARLRAELKKRK